MLKAAAIRTLYTDILMRQAEKALNTAPVLSFKEGAAFRLTGVLQGVHLGDVAQAAQSTDYGRRFRYQVWSLAD